MFRIVLSTVLLCFVPRSAVACPLQSRLDELRQVAPVAADELSSKLVELCGTIREAKIVLYERTPSIGDYRPPTMNSSPFPSGLRGGSLVVSDTLSESARKARANAISLAIKGGWLSDCISSRLKEDASPFEQTKIEFSRFRHPAPAVDSLMQTYREHAYALKDLLIKIVVNSPAANDDFIRGKIENLDRSVPSLDPTSCREGESFWHQILSRRTSTERTSPPITCIPKIAGTSITDRELAEDLAVRFTKWAFSKYGFRTDNDGSFSMSSEGATLYALDWQTTGTPCHPIFRSLKTTCDVKIEFPTDPRRVNGHIELIIGELRKSLEIYRSLGLGKVQLEHVAFSQAILRSSSESCLRLPVHNITVRQIIKSRDGLSIAFLERMTEIVEWLDGVRARSARLSRATSEMYKRRYADFARRLDQSARSIEAKNLKESQNRGQTPRP